MQQVIPAVSKVMTKTMLKKGNPDCFKELRALVRLFGVDFDSMERGDKVELPLVFKDGTETTISFNRVAGKGGRKDPRYNIPAPILREQVSEGDRVAFTFQLRNDGNAVLCVNVTRQPEFSGLATDDLNVTALGVA